MDNKKLLEEVFGQNNPTMSKVGGFAKIRSWGDKNKAITHDGLEVRRLDSVYIEGYGVVTMTQYELHFLYEDKSKKIGRWTYMCSCGSPAGIVSYNSPINKLMSKPSEGDFILVCLAHTTSRDNVGVGKHADNSTE
jgi:hypothetical protein